MSKTKQVRLACENSQFISRLSMERCRSYISHMQAILHMCEGTGDDVAETLQHMMQALDAELRWNLQNIGQKIG